MKDFVQTFGFLDRKSSPTQTLPSLSCANEFVKSTPTMQIPIQLIIPSHMMKAVETRALIDSGASISCIDWGFVRKQGIPTQRLKNPSKHETWTTPSTLKE